MTKVSNFRVHTSARKVSSFAGISFVINELEKAGIPEIINASMPKRHGRSTYSWADNIMSLVYGVMAGAQRIEDFKSFKPRLHDSRLNIPGPLALARVIREKLRAEPLGMGKHTFYRSDMLNGLLMDIALHLEQLSTKRKYTLDYDNTCIETKKADSEYTYKKFPGYQPGVCFVGGVPVYVEGRNGNAPAAYRQKETLEHALDMLKEKGIQIRRFRADAASYKADVIDLMADRKILFFIRAHNQKALFNHIMNISDWKDSEIGTDRFQIASFFYRPFDHKGYRIVVTRRPSIDGKRHEITGQPFVYRSIITNCKTTTDIDVVWFYNQRGGMDCEKMFDVLGNDWNWNKPPFSYLAENTAYWIITAMGFVMFRHVLEIFSERVDFVEETDRLKRFRFNVISVAGEWRGDTLLLFDRSRPWGKLVG